MRPGAAPSWAASLRSGGEWFADRRYGDRVSSVLDTLLEGFDEAKHPRGPLGRWISVGDHIGFHAPSFGAVTGTVKTVHDGHVTVQPHFDPGIGGNMRVTPDRITHVNGRSPAALAGAASGPGDGLKWNKRKGRLEGSYQGVKLERGVAYQGELAGGKVFTGHWTGEKDGDGEPIFKQIESGARRTFRGGKFHGKLADVKPK